LPLEAVSRLLQTKGVPNHRFTFWYLLGGLTLFFLGLQVFTGILLTLHYVPSPDGAHESVRKILEEVRHGWFVRSVHGWSANILVFLLLTHMFSVFFLKAYRKPRELIWLTGVGLLFITLGFLFTGHLLPWDTTGYFATLIGTEVPKSMPIVGDVLVGFLKGGEEIAQPTLSRMYSIHIIILPLSLLFFLVLHLLGNQSLGSSVPIGVTPRPRAIPFFPNFFYRDLIAWLTGFLVLVALAVFLPWGIGEKADPLASAPLGIRPEWYFLPLYQTLRMVPSSLGGISGELMVNAFVGFGAMLWTVLPFLDRKAARGERGALISAVGWLLIAYLILTIILAYTT
jgi:cytochrome b6